MACRRIAVCLGGTPAKQTFASALDWPGWCVGAGRDESATLAAASYAERYAPWRWDRFTSTVALDVVEWGGGTAGLTTATAAYSAEESSKICGLAAQTLPIGATGGIDAVIGQRAP